MPYMMTDLATGSRAAEQFQQDIAEAPYVSDITQTGAERKLQENRLALQYAPEEAAAKAEKLQLLRDQERINALYAPAKAATQQAEDTYKLQKTMNEASAAETERVFKEAGYKADTESTDKFKTWMTSDEGKNANDIQRLEIAAQFKAEAGLTKQAAELYAQIENINTKETANKAKELKNANESLASANALMQTIPDEDVTDYIKRLPNNLQKTITNRVGEDNWNKLDGKQKKALLKTLFQDAKQQVDVQIKEIEAQQAVDAAKEVTKRSNYRADKQAEFKGKGNSGDSSKQEAKNFSDVMRVDERLAKEGAKGVEALDKKIAAAEKAKVAADTKSTNWFDKDVEKERTAAATAVDQAKEDKDKYVKQQLERRIKVIETAPTYPGKQAYIDSLKKELSLYGGDEPPPVKEGAAAPASAAASPAPVVVAPTVKYRTPEEFAKDTNADPNISKEAKASMIARYTAGYPAAIAAQKATSNKYTVDNPAKPTSKAEYDALPPGSYYLQNGAIKQKSGGKTAEPAPTSKVAEPAVAATPAEPVMTDAEKQAKAAMNREKNSSLLVDKSAAKPAVAPVPAAKAPSAAPAPVVPKDTSTDFTGAKSADLIREGNINLTKRPVVKNKDGSISTVRSMSFEEDGMQVLIPTVVGNKVVSDKAAIDHYRKTGEHLGMFSSVKAANAYAKKLHEEQDKMYSNKKEKSTAEILRELADEKQKLPEFLEKPTSTAKESPFVTSDGKFGRMYIYEDEGTFVLLPGVVGGKDVDMAAAFAIYEKSKDKAGRGDHIGRFKSNEGALAHAAKLYKDKAQEDFSSKSKQRLAKISASEKRIAKEKQIERLKSLASDKESSPKWKKRGDEE